MPINSKRNTEMSTSSSRTYAKDLLDNLKIEPCTNPSYLCKDVFPTTCTYLSGKSKDECQQIWKDVCANYDSTIHTNNTKCSNKPNTTTTTTITITQS
jgi:hypothetical protein